MIQKSLLVLALAAGMLFISNVDTKMSALEKESVIMDALFNIIEKVHFKPQNIDDAFSEKVFENYLKNLDGAKRFFTQAEVKQLAKYEKMIDDQAENRTLEFFDLSVQLIDKAIDRSQNIYEEVINSDIDLTTPENFELDGEKRDFPKDKDALKEHWRQYLKYYMVREVEEKMNEQKEDESPKMQEEIIEEVKKDTKKVFGDWFDRMDELRRSDRFEAYLNAFTHLYDPHSGYYSPKDKQDFDMTMGGRLEGIGARLSRDGEYSKVASIVTGGPAWKGKELEVGDVIMKVTQKGEEGVDIAGMRLDDVVQMIRGDKGTVVILTVKKKGGSVQEIEIERDEVILDVAFARSVILDLDDEIQNIGYIKLPKFYSTFDGDNSCAKDVETEIEKLKAQNVSGIILDLRYNGGGSLREVVTMSGLFFEDGPVVQVKRRDRKPFVYGDEDESVAYNGPLIVMVNSISASASEILAAALQDYERAVIVGSKSTFGKGTVQGFYDLDRFVYGNPELKPLGQVKLTMQKFYRVNGGSNQLKGVIPDIILPDRFAYSEVGEKEYDNALDWSQIRPLSFGQDVYELPNLEKLRNNSQARVQQNETFNMIEANAKRLKANEDKSNYPIGLEEYISYMDNRRTEAKKYEDIMDKPIEKLKISNLAVDMPYIEADSARIARNDDWIESIEKDVYIEEVLRIMRDMQ